MKKIIIILALLCLNGCTSAPIYNPSIEYPQQNANTVEDAIIKGLKNRQWLPDKKSTGVIVATLNIRQHQAVIEVKYSTKGYSIKLISGKMLDYEKKPDGQEIIHKNYNMWIDYLVKDINILMGIPSYSKYESTVNDYDEYHPIQEPVKNKIVATPNSNPSIVDQLKKLKELKDSGLLTDSEFETKRKALVNQL